MCAVGVFDGLVHAVTLRVDGRHEPEEDEVLADAREPKRSPTGVSETFPQFRAIFMSWGLLTLLVVETSHATPKSYIPQALRGLQESMSKPGKGNIPRTHFNRIPLESTQIQSYLVLVWSSFCAGDFSSPLQRSSSVYGSSSIGLYAIASTRSICSDKLSMT